MKLFLAIYAIVIKNNMIVAISVLIAMRSERCPRCGRFRLKDFCANEIHRKETQRAFSNFLKQSRKRGINIIFGMPNYGKTLHMMKIAKDLQGGSIYYKGEELWKFRFDASNVKQK